MFFVNQSQQQPDTDQNQVITQDQNEQGQDQREGIASADPGFVNQTEELTDPPTKDKTVVYCSVTRRKPGPFRGCCRKYIYRLFRVTWKAKRDEDGIWREIPGTRSQPIEFRTVGEKMRPDRDREAQMIARLLKLTG